MEDDRDDDVAEQVENEGLLAGRGGASSSSPGGFEALEMEPGHHHHHQARGALSCGGGKTLIRKCGQVLGAHPKLLWILASTEVWERFSYYGMRAMLVLYLSNVLLARDNLDQVGGLRLLAKACGAGGVLAPATEISDQDRQKAVQAFSSQLYGMYTSCVYLTALGGGLLADRFFGQHAMIVVGAVVMAAGHGFLSAKATFILGLLFIIVGNGCFKPNISARIGKLYDAPQGQGKGVAGPGQKAGMAAAKRDAIDEEAAATFEPAGAKGHREGDSIQNRRDEAFSIFYCAINLGAFIAPLVVGAIRSSLGYGPAFSAAGFGMLIGLFVYVLGTRYLGAGERRRQRYEALSAQDGLVTTGMQPVTTADIYDDNKDSTQFSPGMRSRSSTLSSAGTGEMAEIDLAGGPSDPDAQPRQSKAEEGAEGASYSRDDLPRISALVGVCCFAVCFWAVFEQQGNTLALYCSQDVNLFGMPVEWIQAINPVFILVLTPFVNALWRRQSQVGKEPKPIAKMAIGCALLSTGYGTLFLAEILPPKDGKVSIVWVVLCLAISTLGELYLSPVGLSFVSAVAPRYMTSVAVSFWFFASFFGNLFAGHLGTLYPYMPHASFFLLLAAIALSNAVVLGLVSGPLSKRLSV